MGYNHQLIRTLGVDDESTYGKKLAINIGVDSLGMCTISFGSNYSIRIPEDDVDALSDLLYEASSKLCSMRNRKAMLEEELKSLEEELQRSTEPGFEDYQLCLKCQNTHEVNEHHTCK